MLNDCVYKKEGGKLPIIMIFWGGKTRLPNSKFSSKLSIGLHVLFANTEFKKERKKKKKKKGRGNKNQKSPKSSVQNYSKET